MPPTPALAHRYGAPAPWRRRAVIATSSGIAIVFGTWLAWTAWDYATPAVESELVSFEVVDEHTAVAELSMRFRDSQVEATCLLRAYAEDKSVVGELSFSPTSATNGTVRQTVRTERRATSVEGIGCTAQGQSRPR